MLARRSLLNFLYENIMLAHNKGTIKRRKSIFEIDQNGRCRLPTTTKLHFFTTHPPCGDATIFVKSQKRRCDDDDDEIEEKRIKLDVNRTGAKTAPRETPDPNLPGVGYHSAGLWRTKPGRGERTDSMCCSDKMAKWVVMGVQGSLLSHLIARPIYISTIVIGGECRLGAARRALIGRLDFERANQATAGSAFAFRAPTVVRYEDEVEFGKSEARKPCCTSISWSSPHTCSAIAKGGTKLGSTKKAPLGKRASLVCRRSLFAAFRQCWQATTTNEQLPEVYDECKRMRTHMRYAEVWDGLKRSIFDKWVTHDDKYDKFRLSPSVNS